MASVIAAVAFGAEAVAAHAADTSATAPQTYFAGGINTCDLSQWVDRHDASLNSSAPGVIVRRSGHGFDGCYAKVSVTHRAATSASGDTSSLWVGDGSNSYALPWRQNGAEAWFRTQVLFPDGRVPAYPGRFTPSRGAGFGSGWDMVLEWHAADGARLLELRRGLR
jgi:hypothetical protein